MNVHRAGLALTVLVALAGCAAKAQPPPAQAAVAVAVEPAVAAGNEPVYAGPGTVAAAHTYRIAFEIPGRVVAVNADVGDRVAVGTILATLDASDYAAQQRAANARADAATQSALKAEAGARPEERIASMQSVAAAQAQVDRAQAAAALAAVNARRMSALYAQGDISAQTNDTAVTGQRDASGALAAAQAALANARAQRALVDEGPRDEDRRVATAQAAAARADAEYAATTLAKTSLAAPADAYILSRDIEAGSDAQPGQVAFVLVDARAADVLVGVPASRAVGVRVGDAATVTVGGRPYRARVARIEPSADTVTRTAQIRLSVTGLHAVTGDIAHVTLGARAARAASVPLGAVITTRSGPEVVVYDASRATVATRAVRVVGTDGDRALVRGVAPGERVVVAGQYQAHPGDPVRVVALDGVSK